MDNKVVMGWDAAWTPGGSGAWCILNQSESACEVKLLEVSPQGEEAMSEKLNRLLETWYPSLVAIDMPVADTPVAGYREADRATTRAFSRYGCPVHSPTADRPGEWGWHGVQVLHKAGYRCKTRSEDKGLSFAEVYPHTALLKLLRVSYRFPYKITRASRYWPEAAPLDRKRNILQAFGRILQALDGEFGLTPDVELPKLEDPLYVFKRTEDLIDALICGVSALQIAAKTFAPFGDGVSAIWNPSLKELDLDPRGA